ncbi:hypothetical protein [Adonisia turfae]|nr:hypothetical protein [Adonisia turfae]
MQPHPSHHHATYSMGQAYQNWSDVQNAAKKDNVDYANRLDAIITNPGVLNQKKEGNCGITSAIMALLDLVSVNQQSSSEKKDAKREEINKLIYAIHTYEKISQQSMWRSTYKHMTATSQTNPATASKSIIWNRLNKRFDQYGKQKGQSNTIIDLKNSSNVGDYTLIVSVLLFFKDHLKATAPHEWSALEDFNTAHGFTLRPQTKLKNMQQKSAGPDPKTGDLALTVRALRLLSDLMDIGTGYPLRDYEFANIQAPVKPVDENKVKAKIQKEIKGHDKRTLKEIYDKNLAAVRPHPKADPVQWQSIKFPCYVGVYSPYHITDGKLDTTKHYKSAMVKNLIPYNLLQHWIYMPDHETVWTWGMNTKLNNNKAHVAIKNLVPQIVIPVYLRP